ncbi:MAG: hypothetical protein ACR2IS_10335 [Nitrososphaeraceae archaeon]
MGNILFSNSYCCCNKTAVDPPDWIEMTFAGQIIVWWSLLQLVYMVSLIFDKYSLKEDERIVLVRHLKKVKGRQKAYYLIRLS